MQKQENDITLLTDKALVEKLFDKKAMDLFNAHTKEVSEDYFKEQEKNILSAIRQTKKKGKLIGMGQYFKIAIAAAFITIAATTFIYLQPNKSASTIATNLSIQEVPTSEIESYVNANEAIAEIDWQSEINNVSANLDAITNGNIQDSNKTQD